MNYLYVVYKVDNSVQSSLLSSLMINSIYYDLKLELRLHLGKGLRKNKGIYQVVKCKDTEMYLHYIYYGTYCYSE